jgi:hypothetical protein
MYVYDIVCAIGNFLLNGICRLHYYYLGTISGYSRAPWIRYPMIHKIMYPKCCSKNLLFEISDLSLTILFTYLSEVNTDNFKMIRILVGRGEPYRRSFRHRIRGLGDGGLEAAALRENTDW